MGTSRELRSAACPETPPLLSQTAGGGFRNPSRLVLFENGDHTRAQTERPPTCLAREKINTLHGHNNHESFLVKRFGRSRIFLSKISHSSFKNPCDTIAKNSLFPFKNLHENHTESSSGRDHILVIWLADAEHIEPRSHRECLFSRFAQVNSRANPPTYPLLLLKQIIR